MEIKVPRFDKSLPPLGGWDRGGTIFLYDYNGFGRREGYVGKRKVGFGRREGSLPRGESQDTNDSLGLGIQVYWYGTRSLFLGDVRWYWQG